MPPPEFVSLIYSPWSEKARWALEHHQIAYKATAFQPLIGEPGLKLRMRRFGKLSVPLLYDGERWVTDSFDIARWADAHGEGTSFQADRSEVEHFNALGERALEHARAIGLVRILHHDTWALSLVPKHLRPLLGPLALPIAKNGIKRTLAKYDSLSVPLDEQRAHLADLLEEIRAALGEGDDVEQARTLLPTFSYADIAVAQVLQMIEPKNLGGFRISREGQEGYRDPELAERFADLSAWRDALYRDHRPPTSALGKGKAV